MYIHNFSIKSIIVLIVLKKFQNYLVIASLVNYLPSYDIIIQSIMKQLSIPPYENLGA